MSELWSPVPRSTSCEAVVDEQSQPFVARPQRLFGSLRVRDVDGGARHAIDPSFAVVQRMHDEVVGVFDSLMQHRTSRAARLAGQQHVALDRFDDRCVPVPLEQVLISQADDRFRIEPQRGVVDPRVAQVTILVEHDHGRGLQCGLETLGEQPEPFFALAKGFFGAPPLRHIDDHARDVDGVPLRAVAGEDRPALDEHPPNGAVGSNDAVLVLELTGSTRVFARSASPQAHGRRRLYG